MFDQIVSIEDTRLIPKPNPESTAIFLALTDIDPAQAIMFEDQAKNLIEPARLGATTVWVTEGRAKAPDHVHHTTQDLAAFLKAVLA